MIGIIGIVLAIIFLMVGSYKGLSARSRLIWVPTDAIGSPPEMLASMYHIPMTVVTQMVFAPLFSRGCAVDYS